jgi:hypothetical protein
LTDDNKFVEVVSNEVGENTMSALVTKQDVIEGVSTETRWVVKQRMAKLRAELHDTMSVNPFLMPILVDLHHAESFAELGELLLAAHLMSGHTTSFGNLIDEKILPRVFKTAKLDAKLRASTPPLIESCFNEIDHLVPRPGRDPVLLSLKASRWTIQLTMAMEMNNAFNNILTKHGNIFDQIVVGVFSGRANALTDKYDILRGINRGKVHNVIDIQQHVHVLAGRQFWSWLNGDEPFTQDWVLDGILDGLKRANCRKECKNLLANYSKAFTKLYAKHLNADGTVNWHQLLSEVNG